MFEINNNPAPSYQQVDRQIDRCPLCDLRCDLALPWCNKGTAFKFGLIDADYKPTSLSGKLKSLFRRLTGLAFSIKKVPH